MRLMRDIRTFSGAVRRAAVSRLLSRNGADSFWDDDSGEKLDVLIDHLSDTDHPERRVIRKMVKERQAKSVLDAACGPAVELDGYRRYGLDVSYVGMDVSRHMMDAAKQKYGQVSLVRGKVEQLPFADESFDVVLLKHILEHLSHYEPAIREAVRVARDSVIINLFHPLLPFDKDVQLRYNGYQDNWYGKRKFESFLDSLYVRRPDPIVTDGITGNTATIYLLEK